MYLYCVLTISQMKVCCIERGPQYQLKAYLSGKLAVFIYSIIFIRSEYQNRL